MRFFAGLDVSLEETAICIVNEAGEIVREARVASEPDACWGSPMDWEWPWSASGSRHVHCQLGCTRDFLKRGSRPFVSTLDRRKPRLVRYRTKLTAMTRVL